MNEDIPHVLVVDDDARLRELLRRFLTDQGFRVDVAADAADARDRMSNLAFDLIVLDIMMPGETGLELTRELRQRSSLPVLLLTALGEVEDRIHGLEVGADDYLTKPFEPRELVARMRSILKRVMPPPAAAPIVSLGDLQFDPTRQILSRETGPIHLTEAEANLLSALAARAGQPLSREDLSGSVLTAAQARSIDVQVTRLRRKIEVDSRFPRYLQTVRGKGYVLIPD